MPADAYTDMHREERAEAEVAELHAILDGWRTSRIERLEAEGFSVNARGEVIEPPTLTLIQGGRDHAR
jgi:hypothetical protein